MTPTTYTEETALLDSSETVNSIVARYPQALPVLNAFGLDTCCGGSLPLRVAVEHHALDLATVVAALRAQLTRDA